MVLIDSWTNAKRAHCNFSTGVVLGKMMNFSTVQKTVSLSLGACMVLTGLLSNSFAMTPAQSIQGEVLASAHQDFNSLKRGFQQSYKSGVLAYRRGDYHGALRHLRRAEAEQPKHVNTQYYLAIVLDHLSRGQEAAKYFSLVSQYSHDDRITTYSRQRLMELNGGERLASTEVSSPRFSPARQKKQSFAIPLLNRKNALMLNATINHEATGTFIVDTGATYTSISQHMADQIKDELTYIGSVKITTANGQIKVPKVLIKSITINGLEAHNVEATIINLHHGSSFSGLLGLSFIKQFQLTIDPVQNQLVFQSL